MRPPRVLHLIHHLRLGGAERLLADLLPELAGIGMEVRVACLDDRGPLFGELERKGIPAYFLKRKRGVEVLTHYRLVRLLRGFKVDIIHTHGYSAGLWGRLAAMAAGTPRVVATVHSVADRSQPLRQYVCNRLLQPCTDRFVAVSGCVMHSLIKREHVPWESIDMIHNGIDVDRFRAHSGRGEAREQLGLWPDAFLVGMVARCNPEKGGETWIEAMAGLMPLLPEVRGVMVGDGPERLRWEKRAIEAGIADRIFFAGAREDMVPWLAAMDVLVCPSRRESFGLAAVEAQAAGIPVVATRVDGFQEILSHGGDALLVDPAVPGDIVAAVLALKSSPDLARSLIEGGRRTAAGYSIRHTARLHASLYHELMGNAFS